MNIIRLDSIDSTNRYALDLPASEKKHGTAVIADNQSKGRGRLGKAWHSTEKAGLFTSFILKPELKSEDIAKLTLVAGLVCAESIERLVRVNVELKWPNDLYIRGRKVGGILSELQIDSTDAGMRVVIGIGINLKQRAGDFPEELQKSATSLYIESGESIEPQEIFTVIHNNLLGAVKEVETSSFAKTFAKWKTRDFLAGKTVTMVSVDETRVTGRCLGINEEGELHLEQEDGTKVKVLSGDVQLAKK